MVCLHWWWDTSATIKWSKLLSSECQNLTQIIVNSTRVTFIWMPEPDSNHCEFHQGYFHLNARTWLKSLWIPPANNIPYGWKIESLWGGRWGLDSARNPGCGFASENIWSKNRLFQMNWKVGLRGVSVGQWMHIYVCVLHAFVCTCTCKSFE